MEKKILTQIEYDAEMKRLNDELYNETHALHEKLQEINKKNTAVKTAICQLKMEQLQYSGEYHRISDEIHVIRQKYAELKHEIYLQRPSNAER